MVPPAWPPSQLQIQINNCLLAAFSHALFLDFSPELALSSISCISMNGTSLATQGKNLEVTTLALPVFLFL